MRWAPVPLFEGYYEISDHGLVRRAGSLRPIATWPKEDGYFRFTARRPDNLHGTLKQNLSLHRVVATLFVPNPENKPEVNHDDGDIANNTFSNLVWATKSENNLHRTRVLKSFHNKVQRAFVSPDGEIICVDNLTMFSEQTGLSLTTIRRIATRQVAVSRGWRLATDQEAFDAVA